MDSSSGSEKFDLSRLNLKKAKVGQVYFEYQARLGTSVIGRLMFRYENDKKHFRSQGTVVHRDFQKNGIGTWLWRKAIKSLKPKHITVTTASLGGEKLIRKMKKQFPKIDWEWLS